MSLTWGIAEEFRRLSEQRELAAYRAVAAVKTILDFFEAQDFASAEASLRRVRSDFDEAECRLAQFLNTHKGELRHGNRRATAS